MAFALALAGGGTRGAAHVGVLAALTEAGLVPTAVAGTSAGSLVAGLYACGVSPARLWELVVSLANRRIRLVDPDYGGILKALLQFFTFRDITLKGLIKGTRMEHFLRAQTGGKRMREVGLRLLIPTVDIRTGKTIVYTNTLAGTRPLPHVEWRTDGTVGEAMRASAAVPAVFHPVLRDGFCQVDGGVTDNLPVELLLAAGERRVLAVDVSEEYEAPCHENLIEIASHSLTIMGTRLKERISTGEQFLLHPTLPEDAGLLTFGPMAACMEAGYTAAREQLPVLKALFG